MESSLEYRRLLPTDESALTAFLAVNFTADAPQNRPGWLQWQLTNPNGVHIHLALDEDRIAGVSFFMPVSLAVGGNTIYSGAFATNTMVGESYRRHGVGSKLHRIRKETYDFALSCGQSAANRRLYEKLGFQELSEYQEILLCRRFPPVYARKRWGRELISWGLWRARSLASAEGTRLEIQTSMPTGIPDAFFRQRLPPGSMGTLGSDAYLAWRYARHPYVRYEFVSVWRYDEWLGLAVIRREEEEARFVDFYGHHENMTTVLQALGRHLTVKRITGVFAGRSLARRFSQAGWYTFGHATFYLGDTALEPLRKSLVEGDWCLFAGDADKDR